MTADYIRILLDYNYWARDRVLASAEPLSPEQVSRAMGSSFASVLDTLTHIYFAEWIWYRRWQGDSPSARPDTSQLVSVAALRDAWLPLEQQIRSFVDGLGPAGLSRIIDYKTMSGESATSPYWQMIVHVVNHGTYHRGQVTTLLRQIGAKPPQSTDLIGYYRQRSEGASG